MNPSSANLLKKKTLKDVNVQAKTVLLRVDYNVPLTKSGQIEQDYKIIKSIDTIKYLCDRKCKVIIVSSLGRPKGKFDPKLSLEIIQKRLQELMPDYVIRFNPHRTKDAAYQECKGLKSSEVMLLENVRFDPRESSQDLSMAKGLVELSGAELFVQDAFGVLHHPSTTMVTICQLLPSVAGLLVEREYNSIVGAMSNPERPLVAVIGGAKISEKDVLVEKFLDIADQILIGGAMANNFLQQAGYPIGKSLVEPGQDQLIRRIHQQSKSNQVIIPTDVAVAEAIDDGATRQEKSIDMVEADEIILDIGPETISRFNSILEGAGTVIWNGTLGYCELPPFKIGSYEIARTITSGDSESIVGGGETSDLALDFELDNPDKKFSHISTGGGASLNLMSGIPLPGLDCLMNS